MNTGRKNIESIDEIHARFVRRREQSVVPLPGKLTWVGSLLVLLVLAVASFNAHAQLPDPGMQIDPAQVQPRDLDDVRPGGLGTHLIREVMDAADFVEAPPGCGNLLRMVKRIA